MRELRFRAWDKNRRKWVMPDDKMKVAPDDEEDFVWSWIVGNSPDGKYHILGEDFGIIVQQFTGLKDKNGEEIYEGDILSVPYGNQKINVAVIWLNTRTMFHPTCEYLSAKDLEVIGNIYENHELFGGDAR